MEIKKIQEAAKFIDEKLPASPEIGMILGSGLGELADQIEDAITIPYGDIPHFPLSTVEGHKGQFVIGSLSGKTVLAMQGRFHYYEGYTMKDVTFPVRVMKQLGINKLIITNAAGGVNETYQPGDLMIIEDHINFAFTNPLIGRNLDELGPRFPDTSRAYDLAYKELAKATGEKLGIPLKEGVYFFNTGPTYETPAEIKMSRVLGADAVGMSTVPEAIVAAHSSMRVLGISCITNMAAGILDQPLDHSEVVETAAAVREDFKKLVKAVVEEM